MCAGSRWKCLGFWNGLFNLSLRCWNSEDDKIWWGKVKAANGKTKYRCVNRRVHETYHPPPAARWRSKNDDEGLWVRCGTGCCELWK